MSDARQLRIRIALLLVSSGVLALPSCSSDPASPPQVCGSETPSEECVAPGASGCPAKESMVDSCCNTAEAGPIEKDGQCCYYFCVDLCCGRPFTVGGHARVAGVARRDDWSLDDREEGSAAIDPRSRAALVEAWLADARMEHASVASFARFTLELLALGAPADLVAASQHASLDEIEHARLCFGIASRLGGQAWGPAPLDLGDALRGGSLAESAAHAVREGCIGETVASLVARAQLARAEDGGVRRALARIAEDEEAHAALAWRFVAWALSAGGAPVRAAVAAAFEDGARRMRGTRAAALGDGVDQGAWRRFGRLAPDEVDRVTASAVDEVIVPCAEMLLRG
jgi:hypothetical protein